MFSNNEKLHNLVEIISEFDEEFETLAKYDVEECIDRIKYFIQNEKNLNVLEISLFKSLIEQIRDFYREYGHLESLMEFNYTIKIYFDFIKQKQDITIIKNELHEIESCAPISDNEKQNCNSEIFFNVDHEESIHVKENCLIYDSVKNEDVSILKLKSNCFNEEDDQVNKYFNKQDFETYTFKKQFCDTSLSYENYQVQNHQFIPLIETNNISESNTDSLENKNREFKNNYSKAKQKSLHEENKLIDIDDESVYKSEFKYLNNEYTNCHDFKNETEEYIKNSIIDDLVIEPQIIEVLRANDKHFENGKPHFDIEYDDSLIIKENIVFQNQNSYDSIQSNSLLKELNNADTAYKEFINNKEKHVEIQYSYDQCHYDSRENNDLVNHEKTFHNGDQHPCKRCDYKNRNKLNLKTHIKSFHDGVQYPCSECDYKYKANIKLILMKHLQSAHEGDQYSCDLCNTTFINSLLNECDMKKLPNGQKEHKEWKSRKRKLPKRWNKWRLPKRWKKYKTREFEGNMLYISY